MEIARIKINKNRGWRGLAELVCEDNERNEIFKTIFSFSQDVWDDMLAGFIVVETQDKYVVLEFDNTDKLPSPVQQRSVLIKSFVGTVINQYEYDKTDWTARATGTHYNAIWHFRNNSNRHTTSDWNCFGIRVVPMI